MATNRFRAIRNVSNRLNNLQSRLSYLDRRPAPRRLADNFIFTNNIQRVAIVEPLVAPNAVTNEKIDDDAVDTDEIALDAMTGKNINSCTITDSTFSNGDISDSNMSNMTADTVEGSNYTIDGLVLTSGEITDTTLDGAGVVLTNCTLANCTADVINGDGGLLLVGNGTVGINGSGVAIEGGGSVITVASGNVGIGAGGSGAQFDGSNTNLFGSQVVMAPGWNNVRAGGLAFWGHPQFIDVKDTAEEALAIAEEALAKAEAAQATADSKADAGHGHPGL